MDSLNSKTNHGLTALAWFSGGVVVSVLFSARQLPPLNLTILMLTVLSVIAIASLRISELSLLSRLYVLLFVLPFSATLGYLFDRDYVWWPTPTNILLCQNHPLINEMLNMVIVGLCGLMVGIEFAAMYYCKPRPRSGAASPKPFVVKPILTMPVVWVMLAVAFMLSWLHAPEESIFVAAYASGEAGDKRDVEAGLSASYLISYLILILILVDAGRERPGSRRQVLKLVSSMAVISYIVVVLQLLRGDRECAGLVAALVMLYITSPASESTRALLHRGYHQFKRGMKVFVPLAICVAAFLALGSLRHTASKSSERTSIWKTVIQGATENTWTAVALNNLGLSADYNYGSIEYLYGRTYLDYVLSLPPGAVAKALGYERPLEGDANPALWYFGLIAAGGMHPVVVPFRNFGIWGVLPIMILCGIFICYCETRNEAGDLSGRLLYGCVATSSMLWFWYGDMNMIRTIMAWGILYGIHLFAAIIPQRNYRFNPPEAQARPWNGGRNQAAYNSFGAMQKH